MCWQTTGTQRLVGIGTVGISIVRERGERVTWNCPGATGNVPRGLRGCL